MSRFWAENAFNKFDAKQLRRRNLGHMCDICNAVLLHRNDGANYDMQTHWWLVAL